LAKKAVGPFADMAPGVSLITLYAACSCFDEFIKHFMIY